ncbi:MAG: tRNA 4-thiouridine(8) synthase ThiI [Bacteriovoracaceae bacterium]|nr:tRNA 4-thiouridine(8) synthase ThiI [Bacteriovoracaceae bacterium]
MYHVLVISVDELWLKGKNRPLYYKAMKQHLRDVFEAYQSEKVNLQNEDQRLVARSVEGFPPETMDALLKVPGINCISPARSIKVDMDLIVPEVLKELEDFENLPSTFKVYTKRTNKQFPKNSMEVSREVGHLVLEKYQSTGLRVDVHNPELLIQIKIGNGHIYISTKTYPGIGGQPFGTSGHLVTLLSGGFDSPVASFLMGKRGCRQSYIFFYAYPFVGEEVKEKIVELARTLGQYQNGSKLYIIPFGDFQKVLSDKIRPEYKTLFFRKYMLETAEILAGRIGGDALLTGDALSQVSSQTIGNITLLDAMMDISVLRPLIGFNKREILDISKKIKTHDISVLPHDDACSLFAPKHPIIKPDRGYFKKFSRENDFNELLNQCIDDAEILEIDLKGEIV